MKALTLHQPWAQLVAVGVKTVETRSWPTRYRGPLAIHAGASRRFVGANFDRDDRVPRNAARLMRAALRDRGCDPSAKPWVIGTVPVVRVPADGAPCLPAPLAGVVATAQLVDVVPAESVVRYDPEAPLYPEDGDWCACRASGRGQRGWCHDRRTGKVHVDVTEFAFGDLSPGRFAWLLDEIEPVGQLVRSRGKQRLWDVDLGLRG